MYPLRIVEMDILFHRPGQFFLTLVTVPTDGFHLQATKETLHHGIIPAVTPATHAGLDTQCRQS